MYPIHAFGTDAQRDTCLPALASGELIGAFGLTEPDAGSDPGSMKTPAVPTTDGYVLNGARMWITSAPVADVFAVWAKLTGDDGSDAIRGVIVERGAAGLSPPKHERTFSRRSWVHAEMTPTRRRACRGKGGRPDL